MDDEIIRHCARAARRLIDKVESHHVRVSDYQERTRPESAFFVNVKFHYIPAIENRSGLHSKINPDPPHVCVWQNDLVSHRLRAIVLRARNPANWYTFASH